MNGSRFGEIRGRLSPLSVVNARAVHFVGRGEALLGPGNQIDALLVLLFLRLPSDVVERFDQRLADGPAILVQERIGAVVFQKTIDRVQVFLQIGRRVRLVAQLGKVEKELIGRPLSACRISRNICGAGRLARRGSQ